MILPSLIKNDDKSDIKIILTNETSYYGETLKPFLELNRKNKIKEVIHYHPIDVW